jgi:sugar lactone lactonase YvrE
MQVRPIFAAWAMTAFCLAALPAAAADTSSSSRPLQGYSRTETLQDLCGSCTAEKFARCGNQIEGPTFDDQGNLYIVSIADGDIKKITPDGKCSKLTNTGGEPQGLKFHDGKLYGVDRKRGVFTIDIKTGEVKDYMRYFYGQNFSGPNDLIIDQLGGVWFTDAWGTSVLNPRGGVYYISPEPEKKITRVFDSLAFPNGISLSPDNKTLYIDDFNANRVISVPLAGPGNPNIGFAHVLAYLNGGFGPDSMAVDAKGNIYAAHFLAREVVVLDPFGFIVGPIVLPPEAGPFTSNVAFHQGYMYITEGMKNEVWRVKMNVEGAKLN